MSQKDIARVPIDLGSALAGGAPVGATDATHVDAVTVPSANAGSGSPGNSKLASPANHSHPAVAPSGSGHLVAITYSGEATSPAASDINPIGLATVGTDPAVFETVLSFYTYIPATGLKGRIRFKAASGGGTYAYARWKIGANTSASSAQLYDNYWTDSGELSITAPATGYQLVEIQMSGNIAGAGLGGFGLFVA